MRNFETTFTCREDRNITPHTDTTPVDFNCVQAVADCLLDNGDFDDYLHMSQYDYEYARDMAIESAAEIIAKRKLLANTSHGQTEAENLPEMSELPTIYVVNARQICEQEPARISA